MSEISKEAFLGIDTSNYRTSVALYYSGGTYQSSRKLLPVPKGEKGLRQNDAVFAHVKQFAEVFSKLDLENTVIKGVGVSVSPRNTAGSYMPCFSFGQSVASAIAQSHGVRCYEFSHQHGILQQVSSLATDLTFWIKTFMLYICQVEQQK